jgi:hypothetical protein
VQANAANAAPLVWFQSQTFLANTQVNWTDQYQAYISSSQIIPNGTIAVANAIEIGIGQTATVDPNGNLTVNTQGPPSAISFVNQSPNQWTNGIAQVVLGQALSPVVALPLYGSMMNLIAPIETVLLTIASARISTGTMLSQSPAAGVLIDLTSASSRTVNFDINYGWNWGGGSWGTLVQAGADLAPILIRQSQ